MQFNSLFFIALFLPLALAAWYFSLLKKQYTLAKIIIFCLSLWFYAYFNIAYIFILLASLSVNYLLSYLLERAAGQSSKFIYFTGILFNLGMLGYYKYSDFFIANINQVFRTDFPLTHILLPLGISFYTFQQLAYLIDRYKKEAPHYHFLDYACFVSFFPQLVAGPIVWHGELVPQFQALSGRRFDTALFTRGLMRFIIGLAKKVLVADTLAKAVNYGFRFEKIYYLDMPSAWLLMLLFALEIYLDFSAYSDMAIGLANMFGFTLPENFNSPYKSRSVSEFWRNWHITLTRFFSKYVYIPLGGNRHGLIKKSRNLFIVFFLSGFWHGAEWTFIIWGCLQGLIVIWENGKPFKVKSRIFAQACTFVFIVASFTFFRSENMEMAKVIFQKAFSFRTNGFLIELASAIRIPENYALIKLLEMLVPTVIPLAYLATLFIVLTVSAFIIAGKKAAVIVNRTDYSNAFIWGAAILFVWSFISLSQVSVFLYFNF